MPVQAKRNEKHDDLQQKEACVKVFKPSEAFRKKNLNNAVIIMMMMMMLMMMMMTMGVARLAE